MKRPTPLIRSLTENPKWIKKQCARCERDFWVLPSKSDAVLFCAKDCRVQPVLARFMEKIQKTADGHWLWTGADAGGYGKIKDENGKQWRAHRLAYTLFVGPIPEGLDVLHKRECVGHPDCCAYEHLYVGTDEDNAGDRVACGRQHDGRGEKCPTHKITEAQAIEIKSKKGQMIGRVLAAQMGISVQIIWQIWRGQTWKHIT